MSITPDTFDPNSVGSRISSLWEDGKSLREIGLEIGKSHAYVRNVLQQQGKDTSVRRTKDTLERDEAIVVAYTNPEEPTIQEVAALFGLSYNTVQGVLSRAGVTRGRGRPASEEPVRYRQVVSYRPDSGTLEKLQAVAELDRISLGEVVDRQVQRAIKEGYL